VDGDLLRSVFHDDASIRKGAEEVSRDRFVAEVVSRHSRIAVAVHSVTNISIDWIDSSHAFVESHCLAIERKLEASDSAPSDFIYRVRYADSFERRDGSWRITSRTYIMDHVMKTPVSSDIAKHSAGRIMGVRSRLDPAEQLRRASLARGPAPSLTDFVGSGAQ
jgi:hypothetical protein